MSDFEFNLNSGAAGTLTTIGNNLELLGCNVDYLWKQEKRIIKSNNFYRFFELPYVQFKQIKTALEIQHYDTVIISQPHAWFAVKRLKKLYPNTLFINRTHGWELRIAYNFKKNQISLSIFNQLKDLPVSFLLKHCSYLTVKYCDGILCASLDDATFIRTNYPLYKDKVHVISYGLDPSYIGLKGRNINNKIGFLFVGQYLLRKGIKDIEYAFRKLINRSSEFTLTFIVDKSSVQQVLKDFDFLNFDCLSVKSWIDRNQLISLYLDSDVFLMPSYGEGFGKTTLEAMASGLCVIGYKEAAVAEFCRHNSNALISEIGYVDAFVENLEFALDNINEIKKYGQQALEDIQGQTWQKNALQTSALVSKLIEIHDKKV